VPIALLAGVAWTTGVGVFDSRYVTSVIPAQALLLAWTLRRLEPAGGRRAVLALYLTAVLVGRGLRPEPARESWRDAAAAVRSANHGRPVLLGGTYIESKSVARDRSPASLAYLAVPLEYYDAGGTVTLLPLRTDAAPDPDAEAYADRVLARAGFADGFALVERQTRFPSWSARLEARARERGLAMREVWRAERMRAWVFERLPVRSSGS
jgi:hypothetical protein